jgi:hypothetical protein
MLYSTPTIVTKLLISCGMDWDIIWRRVSTSLVYMDMMSPWEWVSKYFMGRDSICVNISLRKRYIVPWETYIISLDCINEASMPQP